MRLETVQSGVCGCNPRYDHVQAETTRTDFEIGHIDKLAQRNQRIDVRLRQAQAIAVLVRQLVCCVELQVFDGIKSRPRRQTAIKEAREPQIQIWFIVRICVLVGSLAYNQSRS